MPPALAAAPEPLRLPGRAESVARARRFVVRQLLAGQVAQPLVEAAALLVSEIVTNAVVHAGGEVGLRVDAVPGCGALVEVCDGSPVPPTPRRHDVDAMTGRGLALVDALATSHGTVQHPEGKVVWFTVGDPSGLPVPADPVSAGTASSGEDGPAVTVVLRNLPVSRYTAMRQHNEALLREYQLHLVGANDTRPRHEVAQHQMDDALAELAAVARARATVAAAVLRVLDAADAASRTMAGVDVARHLDVAVRVPRTELPAIYRLPALLDAAELLARAGVFLTEPAGPGMVELRDWLYGEVLRQAEGRPSVAWSLTGQGTPLPAGPWPARATAARRSAGSRRR